MGRDEENYRIRTFERLPGFEKPIAPWQDLDRGVPNVDAERLELAPETLRKRFIVAVVTQKDVHRSSF